MVRVVVLRFLRFGLAGVVAWVAGFVVGCQSQYHLTVEDRVCRRGNKIRLIGKLEYRGVAVWHKGLDDRTLTFRVDGRTIGSDDTNSEGYAREKHRFKTVGQHRLTVTYEDKGRPVVETSAAVFVWDEDDVILIVDIDGTVAKTRMLDLVSPFGDHSPAMAGAAEVLGRLAQRFRIVYLTARPRELIAKTRRWLGRRGFPKGPVLTWDVDKDPWSRVDYKKEQIDELQDEFDHVTIGIGNTEKDHRAYRKRNLFSIILARGKRARVIERGVRLPDWFAIDKLFNQNPKLYDPKLSSKTKVKLPAEQSLTPQK